MHRLTFVSLVFCTASWENECLFSIFLWIVILFFPLLLGNKRGEKRLIQITVPCTNHFHIQDQKNLSFKKNVTRMTLVVFSVATMLPRWLSGKESACSAGDTGLISGSGRSPGGGNGNLLQYSGLENPVDVEPGRQQSTGLQRVRHD